MIAFPTHRPLPLSSPSRFARHLAALLVGAVLALAPQIAAAQATLGTSPYAQDFDGIGSGLPTGWTARTGATASALGATAALTTTATEWATTNGAFANYASADAPAASGDNGTTQAGRTDRSIGVRQSGSFGDPGAAFAFQVANTTGKTAFTLSFKLQSLDAASPRTVTWRVDYGFGATPGSFTAATTSPATITTGGTAFTNTAVSVDFGSALDNNAGPVWIRVATVTASTGSGSRPTTGLDDFSLNWSAGGVGLTATALPAFGAQCINAGPYGPNSFTITGTGLSTADVTVGALAGYSYSTTAGGTYTSTLSLAQGGGAYSQDIHVQFDPAAVQSYNGNIAVGGGGATSINVAAGGSGVNTAPTVGTGAASAITNASATVAGTLNTASSCGTVTAYGIEYSTTAGFTPGTGTAVASGNLSGTDFSSALAGLASCTAYYTLAYATTASGTTYGTQGTFTTSGIAAPAATAGTGVTDSGFTANWGAVSGASGYRLDVYTATSSLAADLFISEYVEGSSNNKYIEIFNGTGAAVNLADYELRLFSNGSPTPSNTTALSGTLAINTTKVYRNTSATIFGGSTTTSAVAAFSGDDAVALYKVPTSSYVDIIGEIGADPGSAWTGGGLSTLDRTLVRKAGVNAGVSTNPVGLGFPTLATEWDGYAIDDVSHLGSHTFNSLTQAFVPGYNDLSVAGTSQAVSGLDPGTTYYYEVRSEAGSCTSAGSNEIEVTTLVPGCTDPLADNYDAGAIPDNGSCTYCTPTYSNNVPTPTPIVIGTGIPDQHMAVSQDCRGIDVALSAFERYVGEIIPTGNVYTTTTGNSPVSGSDPTPDPVLARWNVLGSVDLGSYDFTQVNVFLDVDFDPGATPVWQTINISQSMIDSSMGALHVYQASENLAAPFWAVAFPGVTFDPHVAGIYDVRVRLESVLTGAELVNMAIQVVVEPPPGCTDPLADNYDAGATTDDGSCTYCAPTITYDAPTPTPITVGTGIPDQHMAVSQDCRGIDVALNAFERYVGEIVPAGNVYTTTTGNSPVSDSDPTPDPVLARWNVLGSVDLGSYDFTQVNVFLDVDFDPGATPVWQTLNLSQNMIDNSMGGLHVYQASENLAAPFWTITFPGVTFDPDVPGVYDVRVRLESAHSNEELVSMAIQVVVDCAPHTGPVWHVNDGSTAGDTYTTAVGSDSNSGSAHCPFATIAHAIAQAGTGDTILVDAGTYVESGQIVIDKDLVIRGAGAGTVVKPDANMGNWIEVQSGMSLNLEDLALDGTGRQITNAVYYNGNPGGHISGVNFKEIKGATATSYGTGVFVNAGPVDITGCTFEQIGRIGIRHHGTGTIIGNVYTGKGTGTWLDYFAFAEFGGNVTISGNEVSGCLGVASDGSPSGAIGIWDDPGTTAIVQNNNLYNNSIGVAIAAVNSSDPAWPWPTFTITNNDIDALDRGIDLGTWGTTHTPEGSIEGNDVQMAGTGTGLNISTGVTVTSLTVTGNAFVGGALGAQNTGTGTLDASCNWWGTGDPSALAARVSGAVQYLPFYGAGGADTDVNTPGYQPVDNSCDVIYYSQASGDVTGPIWDIVPVGTAGPASFTPVASMVVQNGHAVTNTAGTDVKNLTVETGGSLALATGSVLNVHGGDASLDGGLTAADNSTLALVGATGVNLQATAPLDLYNLTVNTPNGAITDAAISIHGTLQLTDGELESLLPITLASTATGTGRLGPVATSASYTGDITMQRYIPAGHTNWRFLGSAVAGQTVNNWKDDFYTAGFPGSHYPDFYSPVGSGILWPSIRYYDETVIDTDANIGLLGVTNTQALAPGRGFQAWSGDNFSTTTAFTVDVTGAPHIASSPINLPLSFTSSGNLAADGWNLVSNPLPSPIDFTLLSRGADVQNAYWIFDPVAGNLKAWTSGVGQGSLNGILQSSQGFYLKADGAAVGTTVSESAKVEETLGGTFGGSQDALLPILTLSLNSAINPYSDEATIVFANGTPAYDAMDALKFTFKAAGAPQLSIQSNDGQNLAVDFHGDYATAIQIPLLVNADITGTYTLSAGITGLNNLSCLSIQDLQTGTVTALTDGATYSFTIGAEDDADSPRFLLNGTAPLPLVLDQALCSGQNGAATVVVNEGPVDIQWADAFGNVLSAMQGVEDGVAIFPAPAGNYTVRVTPGGACGELVADFTITAPAAIEAAAATSATTCPNGTDGTAELTVMGGSAPYTYLWSNGSTADHITAAAGNYTVDITDAEGCTVQTPVAVPAGEGTLASFTMDGTTAVVNNPVAFTNTTVFGEEYTWDFGDGTTSNDVNATHTWTVPGTYAVTLTATGGACSDVFTMELTVDATTAIEAMPADGPLAVWATPDHIVIQHAFNNSPVDVDVFDATGRLAISRGGIVQPGRILIDDRSLNTGVWLVRITSGGTVRTFRLPLVR